MDKSIWADIDWPDLPKHRTFPEATETEEHILEKED